jgi:hypothetical protein
MNAAGEKRSDASRLSSQAVEKPDVLAAAAAAAAEATAAEGEAAAAAAAAQMTAMAAEDAAVTAALEGLVRRGLTQEDFDLSVRLLFAARLQAACGTGVGPHTRIRVDERLEEARPCVDTAQPDVDHLSVLLLEIERVVAICAAAANSAESDGCPSLDGGGGSKVGPTSCVSNAEDMEIHDQVQAAAARLAAMLSAVDPAAPCWAAAFAALAAANKALRRCHLIEGPGDARAPIMSCALYDTGRRSGGSAGGGVAAWTASIGHWHQNEGIADSARYSGHDGLDALVCRLLRRCSSLEDFDAVVSQDRQISVAYTSALNISHQNF